MQLQEALSQIADIRTHVERAQVFRGYRSLPVAASGFMAWAGGLAQPWLIDDPPRQIGVYLGLWIGVAVLSVLAAGGEIAVRYRQAVSETERARTRQAVSQFLPCLLAGGLLTVAVMQTAPQAAWLLPGLWAVLFSLGIFASLRLLPRAVGWVAVWYLLCGLATITCAQGDQALTPWAMSIPFGCGQLSAAAILKWKLERPHAS